VGFFNRSGEEQVMGSFILSEIRDLRKGMEGRDGELRGEIAAVRDAVATLSESVSSSHNNVRAIRQDLDNISGDVKRVRQDVDAMQNHHTITTVKKESAWVGPKDFLKNLVLIGAGATAVIAILKFAPFVVAFLAAIPVVAP
jgi:septal ring factor EnvC (AmiA/AmiB activator)